LEGRESTAATLNPPVSQLMAAWLMVRIPACREPDVSTPTSRLLSRIGVLGGRMTPTTLSRACLIAALAFPLSTSLASAQLELHPGEGSNRMSVTVSFGAGLNTAAPGVSANHHILPNTIEVKAGGVVNFIVAGFHQIVVYNPGTDIDDIVIPEFPPNLFVNYQLSTAYYVGLNPDNANPATDPAPANRFNGENRTEAISFTEPGVYLVICNVTPHLRDRMFAYIKVSG
jgi:plastocyanin